MDPFIGEIRPFAFNFAPTGWAQCNGQLLPIAQNTAVFSLLGTFYGGNGTSNFALPNLQGNVALGFGNGPGLTSREIGEVGGETDVTLLVSELPSHTHALYGDATAASQTSPTNALPAVTVRPAYAAAADTNGQDLNGQSIQNSGNSLPHNNMQPYVVINYCIALQGVFPSRS